MNTLNGAIYTKKWMARRLLWGSVNSEKARRYGPAKVAADHVSIIVLEVANTPGNTVVSDGRVACRRWHNHFLDPGRRRQRRRPRVVYRQAAKPRSPAAAELGRRWRGRQRGQWRRARQRRGIVMVLHTKAFICRVRPNWRNVRSHTHTTDYWIPEEWTPIKHSSG